MRTALSLFETVKVDEMIFLCQVSLFRSFVLQNTSHVKTAMKFSQMESCIAVLNLLTAAAVWLNWTLTSFAYLSSFKELSSAMCENTDAFKMQWPLTDTVLSLKVYCGSGIAVAWNIIFRFWLFKFLLLIWGWRHTCKPRFLRMLALMTLINIIIILWWNMPYDWFLIFFKYVAFL